MKEIQYPLRGIDPFTGSMLPVEITTIDGRTAIRDQESVDISITYKTIKQRAQEEVNKTSHIENLDPLILTLLAAVNSLNNPQKDSAQMHLL